jgi:small subunit ribosomal protein S20
MPNLKSAKKRMRVSERQRKENYSVRSRVRRYRRLFLAALAGEDKPAMQKAFSEYCSVLDKAAKRNVLKKNTAIRYKSRAANKLRAIA